MDGLTGKQMRGNEIKTEVIRLARGMQQKLGIKSGDIISVCSENRIEFCLTFHAAFLIGATVAPLNISYTERTTIKNRMPCNIS